MLVFASCKLFCLCYRSLSSHGHKSFAPHKAAPRSFRARFQSPVTPASAGHYCLRLSIASCTWPVIIDRRQDFS